VMRDRRQIVAGDHVYGQSQPESKTEMEKNK
jgi:hypothetical protein